MAIQKLLPILFLHLIIIFSLLNHFVVEAKGLKVGFYRSTCPAAEEIIRNITTPFILQDPTLAAPLIRMQFHDCFVRGCDGSLLLNSTKNNQAEKEAMPNKSLRGFYIIDAAKSALERMCPGVVSCSDTLAIVVRDAISAINGPHWKVHTGRRDGTQSSASEVLHNLPAPFSNITNLKEKFLKKGLFAKDLVVLSGAHTIGISHCSFFTDRLYNFSGKGGSDPSMDPKYVIHLKKICKRGDMTTTVQMDPKSFIKFDKSYYTQVTERRGLFTSDSVLLDDDETRTYVNRQAYDTSKKSSFRRDFAKAMVRLTEVGALTQGTGEIRKHCAFNN